MISSEVQRTLVKSPPELWAELSDPSTLSRHLGELGEIRITRTDPEQSVEWEAEDTTGTVLIKSSGWGTKVTLTALREAPEPEPLPAPESRAEPEPTLRAEQRPAVEPEPEPQLEPLAAVEVAPEPEPERASRRSYFSRLFRRRRSGQALEPEPSEAIATAEPAPEQSQAVQIDEPLLEVPEEESSDACAELRVAEEVAAEHLAAVLTAVLDRLGAAHHRPFSRA
jgi:hypothetical protein